MNFNIKKLFENNYNHCQKHTLPFSFQNYFKKNCFLILFYFKLIIYIFFNITLKIILKNKKKYYFNIFSNKKHFKKILLLHPQIIIKKKLHFNYLYHNFFYY